MLKSQIQNMANNCRRSQLPPEAHLEIDYLDGQYDAGKHPLVCHKAVEASDILRGVTSFVHESVEWRPEPAMGRAPTGEHLVTCRVRDSIPEFWVVKEIVMRPVVKRWPGNRYQIYELLWQWLWGRRSTSGNMRKVGKLQYLYLRRFLCYSGVLRSEKREHSIKMGRGAGMHF
jgi:hypothetical protein